jgi:carbon storage regulator
MLILTRRIGETIRIGEDVIVTVLDVRGAQIRIGVQAPRSLAVHREEVFNRIIAECKCSRATLHLVRHDEA